MTDKNAKNGTSRARRRPEDMTRPTGQPTRTGQSVRRSQPVRESQPARQMPLTTTRFEAGRRTPAGNARAVRKPTEMTALDPKKTAALVAKQKRDAEKEAAWQKDIVRVRGGVDVVMLVIILLLVAFGTIAVFSSSYPVAIAEGREANYYIIRQVEFVALGAAAMVVICLLPINFWKKWLPIVAYAVSAVLLAYTAVRGLAAGVTHRWVRLGPIQLQPSELMKVSVILMLAWYADKFGSRTSELDDKKTRYRWEILYPCLILGGACGLVMIGKHLSGTIIVGLIGLAMLIIGGTRLTWLFGTLLPAGALAIGAYLIVNPYAFKRITTFTDENANKLDELYQTTQSLYAIGSGGLFGVGIGESRQKYSYLTAAHTDFIFAIWCEEWGFVGAVFLILLFLAFVWRGCVIAVRAPDKFTMLTAFGITVHIGLQAFLNMCVASDIIMNTGITLPFFSYGGSSTLVTMAEMGILLAISRQSYRTKAQLRREKALAQAGLDE